MTVLFNLIRRRPPLAKLALFVPAILALSLVALCEPPPPPVGKPVCTSGIEDERTLPNSYTALCSAGQGTIEVEIHCLTHWTPTPTWYVIVKRQVFRSEHDPLTTVTVACPKAEPYVWWSTTIVVTYKGDPI